MKTMRVLIIAGVLAALFLASVVLAESGVLTISWWTVDGGGGASSGGDFYVQSNFGQPDAGKMDGGEFTLVGGYWGEPDSTEMMIYIPLVLC